MTDLLQDYLTPRQETMLDRSVRFHEAGHCLMCIAVGWRVLSVQTNEGHPHLSYIPQPYSLRRDMLVSTAGDIAGGIGVRFINPPQKSDLRSYLSRFHSGDMDTSDRFQEAKALVQHFGKDRTEEAVEFWASHFAECARIFDTDPWRYALSRLARELEIKEWLTGERCQELVQADELRAAVVPWAELDRQET